MNLQIVEQMPDRRVYGALLPYSMMHPSIAEAKPKVTGVAHGSDYSDTTCCNFLESSWL